MNYFDQFVKRRKRLKYYCSLYGRFVILSEKQRVALVILYLPI